MIRHAAHRGAFTESAVLARQRQFQLTRSSPRVIEEHLIKVTEAEEKNAVLIFRLGIEVLLHHRCDARHVCSPLSFLFLFNLLFLWNMPYFGLIGLKTKLFSSAAPVASAEAKMLLSGAPESNQRAPRGGCRMSSLGDSPLWTPPAAHVCCARKGLVCCHA